MASAISIISLIIVVIISIVILIVRLRLNKDIQKIDVTANMPLVENICRREFTNGYYSGVLKSIKPRKNGCSLIEFYPIDVEQGENVPRPDIQGVVVRNEYIKWFSRGELSSYREVIKLIGRNPVSYPEKMRDTDEGKWATKEGQLGFLQATFGRAIPVGDEAMAEKMKDWSRTGATKNILAEIKEINAQYRKLIPMQREEPKEQNK